MILWATGFRPAVDHLAPLKLREAGGGIRAEDTRAVRDGRVHLVGYGPSASTIGANRAGRTAVRSVMRLLDATDAGRPEQPEQPERPKHPEEPGGTAGGEQANRAAGRAVTASVAGRG